MSDESLPELSDLSAKLGQLIRTSELKVAGKLLATARGHLHQLADKESIYQRHYEQVAALRNELMEPGDADFDPKRLLSEVLEEEKQLSDTLAQHPSNEALVARAMLRAAGAVVLVFAQDMESDAPLDF